MERLVFEVYGRFVVHAEPTAEGWRLLQVGADGKRGLLDVVVPPGLPGAELAAYLDELFHELASPGDAVRRLE
jgi:hypothetical protein